eukprot:TRINITY_DN1964_c0_g1_i1.p1 TRINITY_DN1964_c0_g1~~TRINITY_DN1964_c0_g1_i1.p1  ORF type:complete len:409 (-),score=82.21 TRINITY_DN1964_c0_g1_i1:32-1090(-)
MLPDAPWYFTDDTSMAIGIMEVLLKHGTLDGHQEDLALVFSRNYWRIGPREYTNPVAEMLKSFQTEDWRTLSKAAFNGTGSYGNGSAMRVAPLGAFFALADPEKIVREATLSAQVTHYNPEGEAGAIAMALAAAYVARRVREGTAPDPAEMLDFVERHTPATATLSAQVTHYNPEGEAGAIAMALAAAYVARRVREGTAPDPAEMLDFVERHTPATATRTALLQVRKFPFRASCASQACEVLGNGNNTTCQDTVPFVLWCAATALTEPRPRLADVMWMTLSARGDRDTNCAMVGGIIGPTCSVEELREWYDLREPLMTPCWPEDALPAAWWPLGPPAKGKDLHPVCPHTQFL